jgi:8-oxo-dGTP pyrophosphatase MutT (NUDIX family)
VTEPTLPTPPRPASTVLIARPAADGGCEILLLRRAPQLRFMAGLFVFPGGAVGSEDRDAALEAYLSSPAHPWPASESPDACRAHALAAVRECCEEAGLLLGAAASSETAAEVRRRLLEGERFGRILDERRLRLGLADLIPLSRWITPREQSIRFDTRFYVAAAPDGQRASADTRECTEAVWRTPEQALAQHHAGTLALSPPTQLTLHDLAPHASQEALWAFARSRPPPTIEPMTQVRDGRTVFVYPGDPGHPVPLRALRAPRETLL